MDGAERCVREWRSNCPSSWHGRIPTEIAYRYYRAFKLYMIFPHYVKRKGITEGREES